MHRQEIVEIRIVFGIEDVRQFMQNHVIDTGRGFIQVIIQINFITLFE